MSSRDKLVNVLEARFTEIRDTLSAGDIDHRNGKLTRQLLVSEATMACDKIIMRHYGKQSDPSDG